VQTDGRTESSVVLVLGGFWF